MATRPRPLPQADPLADLREPGTDAPGLNRPAYDAAQVTAAGLETTPVAPEPGLVPRFDPAWHEDAVLAVVRRWHADGTAQQTVHRGGGCPCAYLARVALLEAVGVSGGDTD